MATKRGYYRAELLRANKNLEMALTHLYRLVEAYADSHPEVAIQVGQVGDAIVQIADVIEAIHDSI